MDFELTLKGFDILVVLGIVVLGNFISIGWVRYRDRVQKQKLVENFLSHIQAKIQTEEEFQVIIDQMRKDFGNEQQ